MSSTHPLSRQLAQQIADATITQMYEEPSHYLAHETFEELVAYYGAQPTAVTNDLYVRLTAELSEDQTPVLRDLARILEGNGEARAMAGFLVGLELGRLMGGAR